LTVGPEAAPVVGVVVGIVPDAPGDMLTSLGTITPRRVSGTTGSPPSAEGWELPGFCGGGSLTRAGPQAPSNAAPAIASSHRLLDLDLIASM
jgi:hypothetical protein